ncbi:MAG: hypothetical protein ABW133_02340 [Polyangiaceae bacterium]
MRGNRRWVSVGAIALVTAFIACGGDDDEPGTVDAGSDAREAGRGGAGGSAGKGGSGGTAGSDAGRADTSVDSGGAGGSAGTSGTGGSAGSSGAPDVRVDTSADGGPDVSIDGTPATDARNDGSDDARADSDSATPDAIDAGTSDSDATITADATDGGDATSIDATADDTSDGDGTSSDVADSSDAFDAPSCNDSNPATFDFYSPIYGCGHKYDANPGDGDAWIVYDAGFHVDVATGLGWVIIAGSRSAADSTIECAAHTVAGLSDWRIPTITDARTLAGGCAPTMSNGTCPLADPGCLTTDCGFQSPACNSCTGSQGPNQGSYCKVDVKICTHFHTSSRCSDCDDAGGYSWMYGPVNGNFFPLPSGQGIPTLCVSIVPGGVPTEDGG